MQLNCHIIKKWQPRSPPSFLHQPLPPSLPFSDLSPLSSKKSHIPLVTQFSEGPTPLFNKGWGVGGVPIVLVIKHFNSIATQASHFSELYSLTIFKCKNISRLLMSLRFSIFALKELSFAGSNEALKNLKYKKKFILNLTRSQCLHYQAKRSFLPQLS